MSNGPEKILRAFDLQAGWTADMGAHFCAALVRELREDYAAGGATAALIGDWPGDPVADALPTRFLAALHAITLFSRDAALAAEYPAARADWEMARVWPLARACIAREREWFADFISGPPQTNETRRAIGLLPGFLQLARLGPLHLLELGASAGLNQMWDRFRYETDSWSWGEEGGPRIDTAWRGTTPNLDAVVRVASRAGCDRNPLDIADPAQATRLRAYIWADQPERLARFDAALALARAAKVRIDRADAGEWLAAKLAAPLPEGVTVVYHSVVWQYLSKPTREAIHAALAAAAARATQTHRLAWLRFEPNPILGVDDRMDLVSVELRQWPGDTRAILAQSDGHARWVEAF